MAEKSRNTKIRGGKPAICPAGKDNCPICSGIITVRRLPVS